MTVLTGLGDVAGDGLPDRRCDPSRAVVAPLRAPCGPRLLRQLGRPPTVAAAVAAPGGVVMARSDEAQRSPAVRARLRHGIHRHRVTVT
jgi:hypothetical protein